MSDLYEDVLPISHRGVLIPTEANPDKATDIKELAAGYGIELGRTQRDAFVHYYRLLVEWNSRVRLVGNTNLEEIRDKFFLDSLVMGHTIGLGNGTASLVDVGSGAGFPGVPVAIAWPEVAVTLVESVGKKARFLNTLAQELKSAECRNSVRARGDPGEVAGIPGAVRLRTGKGGWQPWSDG